MEELDWGKLCSSYLLCNNLGFYLIFFLQKAGIRPCFFTSNFIVNRKEELNC